MTLIRSGVMACWVLALVSMIGFPTGMVRDQELADAVRQFAKPVVPSDQHEVVANQIRDDLRTRLRAANDRSSAEWGAIKSREDWEAFRAKKLAALKASLGAWPEPVKPMAIQISSTVEGDGFRIDNVLFESRPGWWVSANLYRPAKARESMPGLVILHAHHTPKEHGELQDMGMTWARAGCYVVVLDQVGHGERRQHPFAKASDFEKPYRVGPADYHFRYDSAIQLQLVGESLMGWMVWDVMRCVDLLLMQPGIDSKRLVLLGSVAGGGDPAAVAGALDERFTAVVPFNFGGPQPETKYPLPDDAETWFGYAGSGSWESTRNLSRSAADGFLPWVIVGSIAPRKLVYGHEFNWDEQRDPVWKRLQKIYGFYDQPASLSWTNGRGSVTGSSKDDTHCTHIGRIHRVRIHEAFRKWFHIDVTPETEYTGRVSSDQLRCWTPELKAELKPKTLAQMTTEIARQKIEDVRQAGSKLSREERRKAMCKRWIQVLGVNPGYFGKDCEGLSGSKIAQQFPKVTVNGITSESFLLTTTYDHEIRIPAWLLLSPKDDSKQPVVIIICSQGANRLLAERADDVAKKLEQGCAVYLIDPRGIGECSAETDRGRRSSATSAASSSLMLGTPLLGQQLVDTLDALHLLAKRPELQGRSLEVWGHSLTPPNPESAPFRQPRESDSALPRVSEPQAPLLALLVGLFADNVTAIHTTGGPSSWLKWLDHWMVLAPYESVVPNAVSAGDISDLIASQREGTEVKIEAAVDGLNRRTAVPPQ